MTKLHAKQYFSAVFVDVESKSADLWCQLETVDKGSALHSRPEKLVNVGWKRRIQFWRLGRWWPHFCLYSFNFQGMVPSTSSKAITITWVCYSALLGRSEDEVKESWPGCLRLTLVVKTLYKRIASNLLPVVGILRFISSLQLEIKLGRKKIDWDSRRRRQLYILQNFTERIFQSGCKNFNLDEFCRCLADMTSVLLAVMFFLTKVFHAPSYNFTACEWSSLRKQIPESLYVSVYTH